MIGLPDSHMIGELVGGYNVVVDNESKRPLKVGTLLVRTEPAAPTLRLVGTLADTKRRKVSRWLGVAAILLVLSSLLTWLTKWLVMDCWWNATIVIGMYGTVNFFWGYWWAKRKRVAYPRPRLDNS